MLLFGRWVRKLSRQSQDSIAETAARGTETLNAVPTVQAFTQEDYETTAFGGAVERAFDFARARTRARAILTAVGKLVWVNDEALLDAVDEVIVMLVHPGRGGQEMLVEHLDKVRLLRQAVEARVEGAGVGPDVLEGDARHARADQAPRDLRDRQHALALEVVHVLDVHRLDGVVVERVERAHAPAQRIEHERRGVGHVVTLASGARHRPTRTH